MNDDDDRPFWKRKTLVEMSEAEWETLCDAAGAPRLNKLEDEDAGTLEYTDFGCRLLDGETCRCRNYPNRHALVDHCERLTGQNIGSLDWLPATCAYRLVEAGRDLVRRLRNAYA